MNDVDLSKGYRCDGQYCFMKQFDMCEKDECTCESVKSDRGSELWLKYAALMSDAFEEIERGEC